ncbi:hypothetical protein VXL81_16740 [Phaeobacter sp. JH204B]|uniref:hypothetical protein n=2 Tax=Phaeobacter TaxID=302485 RepID=UPI003A87167C
MHETKVYQLMQDDVPVNTTAAETPIYIIATQDHLTTCDISDTIHECETNAEVLCHPSIDAAMPDICKSNTLAVVFAEVGSAQIDQLKLDEIIAARSGTLVLMGTRAEAELELADIGTYPWPVLFRPFSASMIKSWLTPRRKGARKPAGNNSQAETLSPHLRIVD